MVNIENSWTIDEAFNIARDFQGRTVNIRDLLQKVTPHHLHGAWEDQPTPLKKVYQHLFRLNWDNARPWFRRYLKFYGLSVGAILFDEVRPDFEFENVLTIYPNPGTLCTPENTRQYPYKDFAVMENGIAIQLDTTQTKDDFSKVNIKQLIRLSEMEERIPTAAQSLLMAVQQTIT